MSANAADLARMQPFLKSVYGLENITLAAMDTDGDGLVSMDEFFAFVSARLSRDVAAGPFGSKQAAGSTGEASGGSAAAGRRTSLLNRFRRALSRDKGSKSPKGGGGGEEQEASMDDSDDAVLSRASPLRRSTHGGRHRSGSGSPNRRRKKKKKKKRNADVDASPRAPLLSRFRSASSHSSQSNYGSATGPRPDDAEEEFEEDYYDEE